jgi:hypothetical protein
VSTHIYKGQTGRTFHKRYTEHIQDIRNNRNNTGFAQHILNAGHSNNSTTDTMTIIKTAKKGTIHEQFRKISYSKSSKTNSSPK